MFRHAIRLPFRLLGIPIRLDLSLVIILPLLAWSIGSNLELYAKTFKLDIPLEPLQRGSVPFYIGLGGAVGLFVSVLIHELGHSAVGRFYGLEIKSITLWLLGGVAEFKQMPRHGGIEAIIAIAGPLTSYALGGVCWGLLATTPPDAPAMQFIFTYLMWMNVVLATFNLLPALPLDGGRVLRSLLALRTSYLRATLSAAAISKGIAFALGLFGFLSGNLFLVLIAFFVYMAGAAEAQMATAASLLQGIRVRDLMTTEVKTIAANTTVADLIEQMLSDGPLAYPVVGNAGDVQGIVSLRDLQRDRELAATDGATPVTAIMRTEYESIAPDADAMDAFRQIAQNEIGRILVEDERGGLAGIISKTDLVRAVQVRLVGQTLGGYGGY